MADAAEEVVFRGVELDELAVLGLDTSKELRVPDRDGDLTREQLEQVLVGALPRAGRRQVTDEHAQLLVAGVEDGPDRKLLARDSLLRIDLARIDEQDVAIDHAEGGLGVAGCPT